MVDSQASVNAIELVDRPIRPIALNYEKMEGTTENADNMIKA